MGLASHILQCRGKGVETNLDGEEYRKRIWVDPLEHEQSCFGWMGDAQGLGVVMGEEGQWIRLVYRRFLFC